MHPPTMQIDVDVADAEVADRVSAEAWACGVAGIEERDAPEAGICLRLFVPEAAAEPLRNAVRRALGRDARVGPAVPVEQRDWSQAWREGLTAVVASDRVVVRPPFADHPGSADQRVLVIDPGMAFGTGHHASTRLALRLLDEALAALGPDVAEARVLDIGTGSGVLALAATALGAREAIGLDIDHLASLEARANARANQLSHGTRFFTGPLAALADGRYRIVVANMIRREILPVLDEMAARLEPTGCLVLSGLLECDRSEIDAGLGQCGLLVTAQHSELDNGERWVGLRTRKASES